MKKSRFVVCVLILVLSFMSLAEVTGQGQFVGSKNSDVYHYPSCRYVQNIHPENMIWFKDAADASSQGYRPCLVCNPPIPEFPNTVVVVFTFLMIITTATTVLGLKARANKIFKR